ncbi:peptidoglycan-binding protein [Micromonospora lupini]|uniref:Putative peptidoglycan binding protein n=1 Tax=Micromonospora lupini str. Lupac 08 TaxID=1150864 RepID=I0L0Y6_9ACTN|nr:peptidoglycan-binding protein [Micromonospora lupini]CCH17483.1 Putative peptidoglycan binding protein [Micromonospora lupini str. Lupac 08]
MIDAARDRVPQAATAGEFVVALRDVRRRSGLTYREISRRASAAGHWLPPSTLATMLGRNTLPRERTVVALLAACGTPAADIERWVGLRREIDARLSEPARWEDEQTPPASTSAEPDSTHRTPGDPHPVSRPARRRLRMGALALVGALTVGALLPRGEAATSASATACPLVLRQGMYGPCVLDLQERLAASGLRVPVDGWFGPDTTSRVIAFQAMVGLSVSGTVDQPVLDALSRDPVLPVMWPENRVSISLRETFAQDPAEAVRVARCLSGLDPLRVEVMTDGSRRWGLFQFSDMELSRRGVDSRTALDAGWNIAAARDVWSRTGDFGHWHCPPAP